MTVYYNDNDKFCAAWLRELIKRRHLLGGKVDQRPVEELRPDDCAPISHFFAGIGGWPRALQLAGWSAARPVWTGSCPCQPFSAAGKRLGAADKRHLWPVWLRLIRECRPPTIFGEQVASRLGREWLVGVRADLEALGYAVGAADLCAAGVGAPHIRQRLFWVAYAKQRAAERHGFQLDEPTRRLQAPLEEQRLWDDARDGGGPGGLGDADAARPQGRIVGRNGASERSAGAPSLGFWVAHDFIPCTDGKSRRVEPGTFPLAHGVPARVGRLRGYGNAVVPQVAAAFVRAAIEALEEKL